MRTFWIFWGILSVVIGILCLVVGLDAGASWSVGIGVWDILIGAMCAFLWAAQP